MRLLPKQLCAERYEYISDKNLEEFKGDLHELFSRRLFDFSAKLAGRFTGTDKFKVTKKWTVVDTKGFNNMPSYIRGTVSKTPDDLTQVKFVVRSNFVFKGFFLICPILGIYTVVSNLNYESKTALFNIGFTTVFLLPAIMLVMSHYAKRELKEIFVNFFGLRLMR